MEFIDTALLDYCEQHSTGESDLLRRLNRDTHAQILMPRMLSGHLQGRLLAFISKIIKPQFVLEIGTYTGYSALCLAEGLGPDGRLISIDVNDELEDFTMRYVKESAFASNIQLISGDAITIIPNLDYEFDLVFIDADKRQYGDYFDLVIDKMKSGGVLLADNVLWSGHVLKNEQEMDPEAALIHAFNRKVHSDPRVEVVMLPVRDGLSLIRKK